MREPRWKGAISSWALLAVAVGGLAPAREIRVPGDYPTIREAIDAAPEGARIHVAAGEYSENLVITKRLTLQSFTVTAASGFRSRTAIGERTRLVPSYRGG